jgi:hypothetical protein
MMASFVLEPTVWNDCGKFQNQKSIAKNSNGIIETKYPLPQDIHIMYRGYSMSYLFLLYILEPHTKVSENPQFTPGKRLQTPASTPDTRDRPDDHGG